MGSVRPSALDPPVDPARDHVLGPADAELTLVEYGSYACPFCHAAHEVVANLRDRFGDRLRYVFRHLPIRGSDAAVPAAELAEYAGETTGQFWPVHDALMFRGPRFEPGALEQLAREFGLPPRDDAHAGASRAAAARVREDAQSARHSGARVTPTFFIGGRRYEGAWDESALAEALLSSLGHRLHTATLDFVRWAPSTGMLLLAATVLAMAVTMSPLGPEFEAWWKMPLGIRLGRGEFALPLVDWVNHGLLTVFFLVVGLEIKRELTVGRLASWRAASLPLAASLGGMIAPALLYLLVIPPGPLVAGWGTAISTDTAFAVALIVLLGDRVPVDLRVFLTAAVIVDDLVAIAVIALFYSGAIDARWLVAAAGITLVLVALARSRIYRALPYAVLGIVLWVCLHEAGLHATLAGVILALVTPTRPPANLRALLAHAQAVIEADTRGAGEVVMRHGPSEPALRALDVIHDRIESPASKLLRSIEPWSSYAVLPVFALANAGVTWSAAAVEGHGRTILAIVLGLVVGKPLGIIAASWLVVRAGIAAKPPDYSWRQLSGAAALAGIGFTVSLFIAGQAFPSAADFAAAKIAIFAASLTAGGVGVAILWPRTRTAEAPVATIDSARAPGRPRGSPAA
jgi:NhaA family Na+:H+ antiporter